MIKPKIKFWRTSRIMFILMFVIIVSVPFLVKNGETDVCYKSEATFWGRQDMEVDCGSNNVDIVKKNEYIDFNFSYLKGVFLWTLILNLVIWISRIENDVSHAKWEKDEIV